MVLWWIANAIAVLVVVPLVIGLANRVIRPAREISGYAEDILRHGLGLSAQLDPLPALASTSELARSLQDRAAAYVDALRAEG